MDKVPAGPSVLHLVADVTGPTIWRTFFPVTALEKLGYPCGWDFKDGNLIGTIAPAFDGYVLPRLSWSAKHRRAAELWFDSIRRAGKFTVYDADDDLFTPAITHRAYDLNWTEGKSYEELESERFERIWALQQCDGATVSTQRLATIVRAYTSKPVIVVPNAIDVPWFSDVVRKATRLVPGLTVGWAGGRRHDRDVDDMAEAWGRIARRFPHVTFVVQGHVPKTIVEQVPAERLVILPWMRPEQYPEGLAQIDIGCCAVADTPFNRCKSSIKAMEYAVAGAAVVASPTLYASLVDHGFSGMLASSAGEWEDGLALLIESSSLRRMMARRLFRVVLKKHSLKENVWRWPVAWSAIRESAHVARVLYGVPGGAVPTGVLRA